MAWKIRSRSRRGAGVRERNLDLFDGAFGGIYALCMEHEAVSRVIGRALWGADLRRWLDRAGFTQERVAELGCFAYFSAIAAS